MMSRTLEGLVPEKRVFRGLILISDFHSRVVSIRPLLLAEPIVPFVLVTGVQVEASFLGVPRSARTVGSGVHQRVGLKPLVLYSESW